MAHVDTIIDQQCARHIILECGLIATTFQQKCNLVLKKHHDREVEEEPATVAGNGEHHQLEEPVIDIPDLESDEDRGIVYEQDYTEIEIVHAENYATDEDVAVEAMWAYIASEDALLAHDIMVGEDFAKTQALNEELNAQFYYPAFMCSNFMVPMACLSTTISDE